MTCGQIPVGGCDLDLAHTGPCVTEGRLSRAQRSKMTHEQADRILDNQLRLWGETDPDRKVPDPPPGLADWQKPKPKPKKYDSLSFGGDLNVSVDTLGLTSSNIGTITVRSAGNGQYVSVDPGTGNQIIWNLDTSGRLVIDKFGNSSTWASSNPSYTWEESQRSAGGFTLRPPHPALDWKRCGDVREHRPHRGYDNTTNCPGRTRPVITDRNEGSWRNRMQVERELRANPIPQEFVLCVCGCACECDGQMHFTDELCPCFYLGCACVRDKPDEPLAP